MKCRCTACEGKRKVMKLGMVMADCTVCKGTGEGKKPEVVIIPEEPIKTVDKEVIINAKKEEPKAINKNNKRKR